MHIKLIYKGREDNCDYYNTKDEDYVVEVLPNVNKKVCKADKRLRIYEWLEPTYKTITECRSRIETEILSNFDKKSKPLYIF